MATLELNLVPLGAPQRPPSTCKTRAPALQAEAACSRFCAQVLEMLHGADRRNRNPDMKDSRSHLQLQEQGGGHGLRCPGAAHRFSRSAPLKVRLEHREPAATYTAYGEVGGPLGSSVECTGASGASGSEGEPGDEVHHLVFSYDPSALSGKTQEPFRYLEGQSVSFVNLKDQREGQIQSGAPPPKPRLYSVASSPLCPDKGLQHSFSLVRRKHFLVLPLRVPPAAFRLNCLLLEPHWKQFAACLAAVREAPPLQGA